MAWEYITHACGHEERRNITGPVRDRDRKAAWWGKRPCTDCWKADRSAVAACEEAYMHRADLLGGLQRALDKLKGGN